VVGLASRRPSAASRLAPIARRLLARCFHILSQLKTATTSEKARPAVLVTTACAGNTAVDLTEQPGPDSTVMRTPVLEAHRVGLLKEDAGPALSFPRFTGRWRNDKAAEDAATVEEVVSIFRTAPRAPTSA